MKCLNCGGKTRVLRPYHTPENETIRHRRCCECGRDMYSIESPVPYSNEFRAKVNELFYEYERELAERKLKEGKKYE